MPALRGVLGRQLMDLGVRLAEQLLQLLLGRPLLRDLILEGPGRDARGDLAGLGAPHSVGDGEHRRLA